jgi:hypothetical protein
MVEVELIFEECQGGLRSQVIAQGASTKRVSGQGMPHRGRIQRKARTFTGWATGHYKSKLVALEEVGNSMPLGDAGLL